MKKVAKIIGIILLILVALGIIFYAVDKNILNGYNKLNKVVCV